MSERRREVIELAGEAPRIRASTLLGDVKLRGGEPGRVVAIAGEDANLEMSLNDAGEVELSCRGDLKILVPAQASIEIEAARGDMKLSGISGRIALGEVSGDLSLRETGTIRIGQVFGDLSAAAVAGDLKVEKVYGDASLRDIEGDLEVDLVGADLSIRSVGGRIRARSGADLMADLSGTERPDWELVAGADLSLRLDASCNASLSLESQAGELELRLEEGAEVEDEDGQASIRLGAGEGRVQASAGGRLSVNTGAERGFAEASEVQWAEMGEEFRNMADRFTRRMEEHLGSMSESMSERLTHLSETLPEVLLAAGLSDGEAQRIASKIKRAGEHAGEKVQRKVEHAMRHAERKMARASQQGRKVQERQLRRWVYTPDAAPAPAHEPVSPEERMSILRMLEAGRISADEAARLLAAIEGRSA